MVASGLAGDQDENSPTIKVVMQKLHKGANSPLAKLKTALKSNSPDWKSIQDSSKDFVILGAALAKNDPPQGEKSNYKKLAEAYYDNAKAMDDAAKAENKQATPGGLHEGLDFVHGLPQGPQAKLTASRSAAGPPRPDPWRGGTRTRFDEGSFRSPPDHLRGETRDASAMPGSRGVITQVRRQPALDLGERHPLAAA